MKKLLSSLALCSAFSLIATFAAAQNKAHIHIKKNQNGVKSEETREIMLEEGQEIQEILLEMGILDEFGQLKPGQDIEIRIDKSNELDELENIELFLSPQSEVWALPEFAPVPEMENRPFLGVMLRENNQGEEGSGVVITEVIEGTAAEKAELQAGDIITKIDDLEIENIQQIISYVQSKEKGDKVDVQYIRDGKKKKTKATLGEKAMNLSMFSPPEMPEAPNYNFRFGPDSITIYCPPSPNCMLPNDSMKICQPFSWNGEGLAVHETAFLGVTPAQEMSEAGVRINVEEETSAEKIGLMDGDVITAINGTKVTSFDQLAEIVGILKPGEIINIDIERDGKAKSYSGEIGKRSVSGFEDFRIFHDFKGMDEGGNYFYDYEFDMDEKDVEERMEQLLRELDNEQLRIEDERKRIEEELSKINKNKEIITIKIQISEITEEDAQKLNEEAKAKIETTNTLIPDQISFFPNPGDGILNLKFNTQENKPVKITLYNSEGEIVYLEERASFDGNYNNTIDISDEPNGAYYLQILQNGKSYSKKIIKGM